MSGDNDSRSYYQRHRHAPHGRIRIVKVHPFRQYALSYPVYSAFGTRQHRFKNCGSRLWRGRLYRKAFLAKSHESHHQ